MGNLKNTYIITLKSIHSTITSIVLGGIIVKRKFNSDKLNDIIGDLLVSVDESRYKANIFHQSVLTEALRLQTSIGAVKIELEKLQARIDEATKDSREYRDYLLIVTVSKEANKNEKLYQEAYEKAEKVMKLLQHLEKEYGYRLSKMNELQRKLRRTKNLLIETEDLLDTISTSMKYLTNNLTEVGIQLDKKEEVLLRIIEAGEIEKKRIARDIHDGPAQTLTHLKIEIQLLKSLIEENEFSSALIETKLLEKHLEGAINETRQIIYDLRPMSLDDLGLIPTLENYIKNFSEDKGLPIELRVRDTLAISKKIPDVLKLVIFRITQESINNAYKHSQASKVLVSFEVMETSLILTIEDDGSGFNVDSAFNKNGRFGLIGMKERVELADGDIEFDSELGLGTIVKVRIPWNNDWRKDIE